MPLRVHLGRRSQAEKQYQPPGKLHLSAPKHRVIAHIGRTRGSANSPAMLAQPAYSRSEVGNRARARSELGV